MPRSSMAFAMAGLMALGACSTGINESKNLRSAGTGAVIGGAAGAAVGAATGGISILASAAVGAAVGGLAGAVWADRNNDGRTDGYYQNGRYIEGAPPEASSSKPRP